MARTYPLSTLLAIVIPISAVLLLALLSLLVCCCCLVSQQEKRQTFTGYQVPWYAGLCGSRKPSYTSEPERQSSDVVPIKPKVMAATADKRLADPKTSETSPKEYPRNSHMSQSHASYAQTSLPEHKSPQRSSRRNSQRGSIAIPASTGVAEYDEKLLTSQRGRGDSQRDSVPDSQLYDGEQPTRPQRSSHGHNRRHSRHLSTTSSIPPSQVAPVPPKSKYEDAQEPGLQQAQQVQQQTQAPVQQTMQQNPVQTQGQDKNRNAQSQSDRASTRGQPSSQSRPAAAAQNLDSIPQSRSQYPIAQTQVSAPESSQTSAPAPQDLQSRLPVQYRQAVQSGATGAKSTGNSTSNPGAAANGAAGGALGGAALGAGALAHRDKRPQKIDEPNVYAEAQGYSATHEGQPLTQSQAKRQSQLPVQGHSHSHSQGQSQPQAQPQAQSPIGYSDNLAQSSQDAHILEERPQVFRSHYSQTSPRRPNESELHADRLPSGLPSMSPDLEFGARRESLDLNGKEPLTRYQTAHNHMGRFDTGRTSTGLENYKGGLHGGDVHNEQHHETSAPSMSLPAQSVESVYTQDSVTPVAPQAPQERSLQSQPVSQERYQTSKPQTLQPLQNQSSFSPETGPYTPHQNSSFVVDNKLYEPTPSGPAVDDVDRFASPGNSLSMMSQAPRYGLDSSDLGTEDFGLNSPFAWQEVEQQGNPLENYERYQTAMELNPRWCDSQEEFGSQRSNHTYATAKDPSQSQQPQRQQQQQQQQVPEHPQQPDHVVALMPSSDPLDTPWKSHRSASTSSRASSLLFDRRKKPSPKVNKPLPRPPFKGDSSAQVEEDLGQVQGQQAQGQTREQGLAPGDAENHHLNEQNQTHTQSNQQKNLPLMQTTYTQLQPQSVQSTAQPTGHTLTPATQTPVLTPQSQTSHIMVPSSPDGVIQNLHGKRFQAVFPYKPALEDELQLSSKDVVRVYQVFDDGWCYAKKEGTHMQGICPKVCLNTI